MGQEEESRGIKEETEIEPESPGITDELRVIEEYLEMECHTDVLLALHCKMSPGLSFRQKIKEAINKGKIDKAEEMLKGICKSPEEIPNDILSHLHTQHFIELIRVAQPEKAMMFGRECMEKGETISKNSDLFLLLAYKSTTENDAVRRFMCPTRREKVFTAVDAWVRKKLEGKETSCLEEMIKLTGSVKGGVES